MSAPNAEQLVRRAIPAIEVLRDMYSQCEVRDLIEGWLADARRVSHCDPIPCRHCGDPILATVNEGGTFWTHEHKLNRCQRPGRPYGYEAQPPAEGPCMCQACERMGPTTRAAAAVPEAGETTT